MRVEQSEPLAAAVCMLVDVAGPRAAAQRDAAISASFFDDFTAEWVRRDPDLATATRYFSGAEQDTAGAAADAEHARLGAGADRAGAPRTE